MILVGEMREKVKTDEARLQSIYGKIPIKHHCRQSHANPTSDDHAYERT